MRMITICIALCLLSFSTLFGQLNTWDPQITGTDQWLHGVYFVSASTGWAVGDAGTILKSTSSGVNWSAQTSGSSEPLAGVYFVDALHGWVVGGCDGCVGGVILKTTDGGATWAVKDSGRILKSVQFVSPTTGWAVGGNGLILNSTDAGETWNQQTSNVISCLESVQFIDDTTGWTGGILPGVLLRTSNAGATWTSETSGVDPGEDVDGVRFADRQTGWYVGYGFPDTAGVGVIKKSTDGGVSWTAQMSGVQQALLTAGFISPTTGWVAGSSGILLKTTNGGNVWAPESSGTQLELDNIAVRPGEGAWISGISGNLIRNNFGGLLLKSSVNLNNQWNIVAVPLIGVDGKRRSMFPSAQSPAFLYNSGIGYQPADSLVLGRGYWVRFTGAQTVNFAGTALDSLSVNLTPGWNLVGGIGKDIAAGNIMQTPPGSIRSIFGYNASYFAATVITHGQGYWMYANQACTIKYLSSLDGITSRAGLTNVALLKTDELPPPAPGEPVSSHRSTRTSGIPPAFALQQNYPNPFNPTTTIGFDLPEESRVEMVVTNTIGQIVSVVVDGVVAAGYRSVNWKAIAYDGSALPSGIYFCRMRATSLQTGREFSRLRKLVIMR